jgi:hypothetical protein
MYDKYSSSSIFNKKSNNSRLLLKFLRSINKLDGTNSAILGAPKYIGMQLLLKQSKIFSVTYPGTDAFSYTIPNLYLVNIWAFGLQKKSGVMKNKLS